jgi:hypothetical protein
MNDEKQDDLECIEPNLVSMRLRGVVDHETLSAFFDEFEPFVVEKPFFVIEVDMREIKSATPEARRVAAERLARLPKFSIAVITEGFAQRMIAKLVLTAHEMLNRGHSSTGFFTDSASARAWLLERAREAE